MTNIDDIILLHMYIYIYILIGGLEDILFFHILGRIIQSDFHIFKVVETTNLYI